MGVSRSASQAQGPDGASKASMCLACLEPAQDPSRKAYQPLTYQRYMVLTSLLSKGDSLDSHHDAVDGHKTG